MGVSTGPFCVPNPDRIRPAHPVAWEQGCPHVGAVGPEGSPPIVVIGTTGDPATPYVGAQRLAEQLSQGVLITNVGEGHLGYNKGKACVTDAVDAYLVDGTVPEDGLRCE